MEQLLGALEIRVAGCDVVETELRKLREKRQVRVQVSPETIHAFKSRIDETEGHHRGERDGRVVEHGEFIHEIAVGMLVFDCSRIALVGQDSLVDSHLVAEESKLLFLAFKEREVLIAKNETTAGSSKITSSLAGKTGTTGTVPALRALAVPDTPQF